MGFKNISIKGLESEIDNKAANTNVYKKETLDHLKERFPNKVDEIFKVTSEELLELKVFIEANEKEKAEELIRKNLIEDDSDGKEDDEKIEENNYNLDTITIGTKSEQIEELKVGITSSIIEKLKPFEKQYNFTDEQKTNIAIGIIAKILKKGDLFNAFSGLGDGVNKFVGKAKQLDINGAINVGQEEVKKLSKLKNIIDNNISDLMLALENNKNTPDNLKGLLSNPEKISTLDKNTVIDEKIASSGEMTDFLIKLNKEIIGIDDKISNFDNAKNSIVNIISQSPEVIQKTTKGLLKLLLKIPFIGGILASLLGYNSPKNALEGFGEELKYAKSTKNLISHGKGKEKSESENSFKIDILKDKDLSDVKYKKLKPLFETCKKEGIDYTAEDFWHKLLNGVEVKEDSTESEKKLFKLHKIYQKEVINGNDFENSKPKESFYEKLNKIKIPVEVENKPLPTNKSDDADLKSRKDTLEGLFVTAETFGKKGDKLNDGDLEDLIKNISLETLLGANYKYNIKRQVGFGNDYDKIINHVEDIRKRAQNLGKDVIVEILKPKTANKITFGELIDPKSEIYRELFKEEIGELTSIDKKLKEQGIAEKTAEEIKNEKDAINIAINNLSNGEFTEIQYLQTTLKFDANNQKIIINDITLDITLDMYYKLKSIEKQGNNITFNANLLSSKKKNTITIPDFVEFIYNLTHDKEINLTNIDGKKVGEIKQA